MKKSWLFLLVCVMIIAATSFRNMEKRIASIKTKYALPFKAGNWVADQQASTVAFTVTHMVVSKVSGSFNKFEGAMQSSRDDFSDAKINFIVDVNSINTDNEKRDRHLKSADFFDVEKYPQMKFESTAFSPQGNNNYQLKGNLTIHGITRPVTFDVTYRGLSENTSGTFADFTATTIIDRFDFGLQWGKLTESGGLVVSKEVTITINAKMRKER